ncbi:hypothetical protein IQ07DRAFT_75563 [Pyrenochaeta sp. DS3sAY3a]|nr:hypothetical protein IQ07DRAFT_75563 [Pyrenochaeta sp. DS3sAY3a]
MYLTKYHESKNYNANAAATTPTTLPTYTAAPVGRGPAAANPVLLCAATLGPDADLEGDAPDAEPEGVRDADTVGRRDNSPVALATGTVWYNSMFWTSLCFNIVVVVPAVPTYPPSATYPACLTVQV